MTGPQGCAARCGGPRRLGRIRGPAAQGPGAGLRDAAQHHGEAAVLRSRATAPLGRTTDDASRCSHVRFERK
jgi:hypothetical protein